MQRRFAAWLSQFLARATEQHIDAEILDRFASEATLLGEVVQRQQSQAEFSLPIRDYLARAVSPQRIADGRDAHSQYFAAIAEIGQTFRVDAGILVAIWGLESAYGKQRGEFPVLDALATLAAGGRRQQFFEQELLAALEIGQSGAVAPGEFKGSWAGAMGHTQFMPASYRACATPFRGEGLPDIWGDDPRDALASTANYLARHGWIENLPWGFEVTLEKAFDYMLSGLAMERPAGEWAAQGVRIAGRFDVDGILQASIIAPAGCRGPALLVTRNFRVLGRYNRALAYAVAAGLLSDRILGKPEMTADWPAESTPLGSAEILEMQQLLAALGQDTGGVDGIAGPATHAGIQKFQQSAGLVPDGFADLTVLERLRQGKTAGG